MYLLENKYITLDNLLIINVNKTNNIYVITLHLMILGHLSLRNGTNLMIRKSLRLDFNISIFTEIVASVYFYIVWLFTISMLEYLDDRVINIFNHFLHK